MESIGRQLKVFRKNQDLTLEELSELTGIPFSRISKLERGIERLNDRTIALIEEAIQVDFAEAMKYSDEIEQLFYSFTDMLFNGETMFDRYLKQIDSRRDEYELNVDYYRILTVEYVIYVLKGEHLMADAYEADIENFVEEGTDFEAVYLDYKAVKFHATRRFEKALVVSENIGKNIKNEKILAMVEYHQGMFSHDCQKYEEARNSFYKAKEIFKNYYNYPRAIACELQIAGTYVRTGRLDLALPIYDKCLEIADENIMSSTKRAIALRNKAWVLILMENYEEALSVLKEAEKYQANHGHVILYKCWCYYRLGLHEKALEMVKYGAFLRDDKIYRERYKLINYLIRDIEKAVPPERLIEQAKLVFQRQYNLRDYSNLYFYLDVLIELLDKTDKREELITYLKLRIELSDRKIKMQSAGSL